MHECKICGKSFKVIKHHVQKCHNISIKDYYDKYIKDPNEGLCSICGKPTKFNWPHGYRKYCCAKCAGSDPAVKETRKATNMKKFGVVSPSQLPYIKDKIKQTNTEKYGVPHAFQSEKVKANIKKTMIERYGVDHPQKCKEIRSRTEQTAIERYGGIGLASQEIKERAQSTCVEKYGARNPFASDFIKEQLIKDCLQKYGVPYHCMTDECRNAAVHANSSCNLQFMCLLDNANIEYTREFAIGNKSYDFKVGNTLIEINPTSTHNSTWGWRGHKGGLDKLYHVEKTKLATDNGYRCICLFDWDDYDKAINILLKKKDAIYARNCDIKTIDAGTAAKFINEYHLQGYTKSEINIGLYHNDELVSIMTFGKPRYNKKYEYELIRYCYSKYVVGGDEKLFSYFIKHYNPVSIISYCDLSKFTGKLYEKLGFICKSRNIKPSKHWVHYKNLQHITDNLLRQRGFDQLLGDKYGTFGKGTSNDELMLSHGFVEVYDCGQSTYVWSDARQKEYKTRIFHHIKDDNIAE